MAQRPAAPADGRPSRLAIVGLDGATFRVLDPMRRAGAMPALSRIVDRGVRAVLRSTVPAYTPPAWIAMSTGVNPGRHGVFGFLENTPQEDPRIAHSGSVSVPTLWDYLNKQSVRAGIFNVPMSYPPVDVEGFLVSGGLAAGWVDEAMPNFASRPEVAELVTRVAGGTYPLDTVVSYENDWRSAQTAARIEDVQRLRRRVLAALLEHEDPRVLFAVFEGADRLSHVHYQYFVETSEWYGRPEAAEMRDRARSYFEEVDRAIADIVEWAGADGHVILVSDHGSGPWEKTLNVNLLLHEWGLLGLPSLSRLTRAGMVAGVGQRVARRPLPRRLLLAGKARVNRGIDWSSTRGFASQVAEQGIHINERDALPHGVVDAASVRGVEDEIIERLRELVDPSDGRPVVDAVVRRDDVIRGPHAARAPHLFPFCRDQRYELSDTLAAASVLTDHRDRPWGYHHMDGVFIAAGPAFVNDALADPLEIVDVLPTALHAAGLSVPEGLDGRVVDAVLTPALARAPVRTSSEEVRVSSAEYPFSREEEAEIEESLRGLGYIE
jgi:predicted AlkP superfamily phosphohydrolase/phosphomutase